MYSEEDRKWLYERMQKAGVNTGSYDDFKTSLSNDEDRKWYYEKSKSLGLDVGSQQDFDGMMLDTPAPDKAKPVLNVGNDQAQQPAAQPTQVEQPAAVQQQTDTVYPKDGYIFTEDQLEAVQNGAPVGLKEPSAPLAYGTPEWLQTKITDDVDPKNPYIGMTRQEAVNAIGKKYFNEWYGGQRDSESVVKDDDGEEIKYGGMGVYDKIKAEGAYITDNPEEINHLAVDVRNTYVNPVARRRVEQLMSKFKTANYTNADDIQALLDSRETQQAIESDLSKLGIRPTPEAYEGNEAAIAKDAANYKEFKDYYYNLLGENLENLLVEKYNWLPVNNSRNHVRWFRDSLLSGGSDAHEDRIEGREVSGLLGDHFMPAINHALQQGEVKAQQAFADTYTTPMDRGFSLVQANKNANAERDPDKILKSLRETVSTTLLDILDDEKLTKEIFDRAQAKGMSEVDYFDKYVAPQIQSALAQRFESEAVKLNMPKSTTEYILRGLSEDNIIAMALNGYTRPESLNHVIQQGEALTEQGKNPNVSPGLFAQGSRLATGMAADFWLWGGWGKVGSSVTGRLLSQRVSALAAEKGITEAAARRLLEEEGKQYLKKGVVEGMMRHIPQSAVTMGGAEGTTELVRGIRDRETVGEIIGNTLGATMRGGVTGTAFGVTGGAMNRLTSQLAGPTRLLGKLAGYEVEAATMYTTEELQRMAAGDDAFENPFEGLINANVKLGFIKASANPFATFGKFVEAVGNPKKAVGDAMKPDLGTLTEEDVADIMQSQDGKELLDAITSMRPARYDRREGERQGIVSQEDAERGAEAYRQFMLDPDRPFERKQKVARLLGGILPPPGHEVKVEINDPDGESAGPTVVRTRDIDGQTIREIHFDSREEAEAAIENMRGDLFRNTTQALEEKVNAVDSYTRFSDYFNEAYSIAAEKLAAGEELTKAEKQAVFLYQHQDELLDIYKDIQAGAELSEDGKNLADIYRQHFEGYVQSGKARNAFVSDFEREHGLESGAVEEAMKKEVLTPEDARLLQQYQEAMRKHLAEVGGLAENGQKMHDAIDGNSQRLLPSGKQENGVKSDGEAGANDGTGANEPSGNTHSENIPPSGNNGGENIPSAAYSRGQDAIKSGNAVGVREIGHEVSLADARMARVFGNNQDLLRQAYEAVESGETDAFLSANGEALNEAQTDAVRKLNDAVEAMHGVDEAISEEVALSEQQAGQDIKPYQNEQGDIIPIQLINGATVYHKSGDINNQYGTVNVSYAGKDGHPKTAQVAHKDIQQVGQPMTPEAFVQHQTRQQREANERKYKSWIDGTDFTTGNTLDLTLAGETATFTIQGFFANGDMKLADGEGNAIRMTKDEVTQYLQATEAKRIEEELAGEQAAWREQARQQREAERAAVEAQRQERLQKGIVGYSEGKPDYSAPESDPAVVAEYLLSMNPDGETTAKDGDGKAAAREKVLKNIQGEKDLLLQNEQQARQQWQEAQDWLDANDGISDPVEQAKAIQQRRGAELALQNISERQKKWAAVRDQIMTKAEKEAFIQERRQRVSSLRPKNVDAIDNIEPYQTVYEENGIDVTNAEAISKHLLDNYREQGEAEAAINAERITLRNYQRDQVQPEIDRLRQLVDDYVQGRSEYDDATLRQITQDLAQVEAYQSALMGKARDLKSVVDRLPGIYAERNKAAFAELPAATQRMSRFDRAKTVQDKLRIAREVYGDDPSASVLFDDIDVPQDVHELVAMNMPVKGISWEGYNQGEHHVRGLQEELGSQYSRGIGRSHDVNGFHTYLAPKGQGRGIEEVVHDIYENQPEVNGEKRYDTQEIRNALLELIISAEKPTDIRDYVVNRRIQQAEEYMQAAEEYEARAAELAEMGMPSRETIDEWMQGVGDDGLTPDVQAYLDGAFAEYAESLAGDPATYEDAIRQLVTEDAEQFNKIYNGESAITGSDRVDEVAQSAGVQERGPESKEVVPGAQPNHEVRVAGHQTELPGQGEQQTGTVGHAESVSVPSASGRVDSALTPSTDAERKAVAAAEAQLQKDIADAEDEVRKSKSALQKAEQRESSRATDMFADDNSFRQEGQLFGFEEMPTDRSAEGVRNRTKAERDAVAAAEQRLARLKSDAEHNSRVRGTLDNVRRQTDAFAENPAGEPAGTVATPEDIAKRVDVSEDYETESGPHGDIYRAPVIVDGKHQAVKVDAPDSKGNYNGSYYEYDGKRFGDLQELLQHIDEAQPQQPTDAVSQLLAEAKKRQEIADIKPIGTGDFGEIYDQFKGKPQEAIDFLTRKKGGDLLGVFNRNGIGDIDMIWGSSPNPHNGKGLAHIIRKHIDTLHDFKDTKELSGVLDDVIKNGEINTKGTNIELSKDGYKVILAQEKDGKRWVLTAFDNSKTKKEKLSPAATLGTPNGTSDNRAVAVGDNSSSEGKGSDNSANDQGNEPKSFAERLEMAKGETETSPTEAQKAAGNYKKGHITFRGYRMSIENPKGSVRSGVDRSGKPWSITMHDTYGYIGKKYGADGDHLDFFINDDNDLDNWTGRVFIVDQKNEDGTFDEHKVMYGYPNWASAKKAYESNYEPGWWDKHVMQMMGVRQVDFDKWLADSDHKRKPFADYFRTQHTETVSDPVSEVVADIKERQKMPTLNKWGVDESTTMGKQFTMLKEKFPDPAVLLFRSGDFFQSIGVDAPIVSKIANEKIVTTNGVQSVTFKSGDLDKHLPALIRAGHRVAVCDTLEKPKATVKRGETEKAGTVAEDGTKLRPATSEDLENRPTVYQNGKATNILAVMRTEESGKEPRINGIHLTNGKRVQLSDLMVSAEEPVADASGTVTEADVDTSGTTASDNEPEVKGYDKGEAVVPTDTSSDLYTVTKRWHKQKGKDIHVVNFVERFDREKFLELKKAVKDFGGYYSSYGRGGFVFESGEADAKKFAESIIKDIKHDTDEQTAADTEIIAGEAESIAVEAEVAAKTIKSEQAGNELISRIDNQLDKINEQLALLGFYEADHDGTFHESYGYMKSAEAKALKDADRLAHQLAVAIGMPASRKKIAKANIAPIGGDITIHLPFSEGKEVFMNIQLDNENDDLRMRGGYFRVDGTGKSGWYGINQWFEPTEPLERLLQRVVSEVQHSAPEYTIPEKPAGKAAGTLAEKKAPTKKKAAKKVEGPTLFDLFGMADKPSEVQKVEAHDANIPEKSLSLQPENEVSHDEGATATSERGQAVVSGLSAELGPDASGTDGRVQSAGTGNPADGRQSESKPTVNRRKSERPTGASGQTGQQSLFGESGSDSGATDGAVREEPAGESGADRVKKSPAARATGTPSGQTAGHPTEHRADDGSIKTATEKARPLNTRNYLYPADASDIDNMTPSQRLEANTRALEVLRDLMREGREGTPEEIALMGRFRGWGGVDVNGWYDLDDLRRSSRWSVDPSKDVKSRLADVIGELDPDGKRGLLDSIRKSALTSYYTPTDIARSINYFLQQAGFNGGDFLDGSFGNGVLEGTMPKDMQQRTQIHGVELDWLTGQLAKHLYPDADIKIMGFQDVDIADNSMDAVGSNIPFGDIEVFDKKWKNSSDPTHKFAQNRIHNYYVVSKIDKTKPGGLLYIMTSNAVMDTPGNKLIREYIADKCEILGAVRLPDNTFKGAGTKVVTDVLFLRKFKDAEDRAAYLGQSGEPTLHTDYRERVMQPFLSVGRKEVPTRYSGNVVVKYNGYYDAHPDMMIGDVKAGGQYREDEFGLTSDISTTDLAEKMRTLIDKEVIGERRGQLYDTHKTERQVQEAVRENYIGSGDYVSNGNLIEQNGKLGRLETQRGEGGEIIRTFVEIPGLKAYAPKIRAMIPLRTAYKRLVAEEIGGAADATLAKLRTDLKKAYQSYQSKYGRLHDKGSKYLENDIDGFTLRSLEKWKDGKFVGLADIFERSTIKPRLDLNNIKSPADAISVSLAEYGEIRGSFLRDRLGDSWAEQCGDMLFEIPYSDGRYQTRDLYLSGDVKSKLNDARRAAASNPAYQKNVEALESVVPKDIPFVGIGIHMGARWIPDHVYTDFIHDLLGVDRYNARTNIRYMPEADSFVIYVDYSETSGKANEWQTNHRKAEDLIDCALKNDKTKVTYTIDGNTVFDQQETEQANDKISQIREKFEEWLPGKRERVEELSALYNDKFNRIVIPHYDGSHLQVPGLQGKELRPHQKDAVWMLINNRGGIIDHIVGAGKTLVMMSSIMEMRRMGIAKKPMIIALKSTVPQMADEFRSCFPAARILAPNEKDFTAKNRKNILSQIAMNDWDCVILSHENYGMLPHTEEIETRVIREQIDQLDASIRLLQEQKGGDGQMTKRQQKALEKRKQRLENKMEKLLDRKVDREFTFESLGVDYLYVDECQQFKSLPYTTTHQNVAGLSSPEGSGRATALLCGARYLQQMHQGDMGLTLLSGTTISNSLVELYNLLQYVRPNKMAELGFTTFDAWASNFAVNNAELEYNHLNELQMRSRFRNFDNLPELAKLYTEVADVRNDNNLELPKPKKRVHVVTVPATDALREITDACIHMCKSKNGSYFGIPDKTASGKDQPWSLLATTISTKAAINVKLVNPDLDDSEGGKVKVVCDNVKELYDKFSEWKGTQMIFCDLGVPDPGKEYDVYNDIINRLSNDYGIPREEIVDIHTANTDAKKNELFRKMNNGDVRILIAGAKNGGTGVNVQERMVAIHHVDMHWNPANIEQEDGRGARQGNWLAKEQNDNHVEIFFYATENSLDLYKYQLVDAKQKMINRFKTSTTGEEREFSEAAGDDSDFDAAAVVAMLSGNPVILEKAKQDKIVERLVRRKRQFDIEYDQRLYQWEDDKRSLANFERLVDRNSRDRKVLEENGFKPDKKGVYPATVSVYSDKEHQKQTFDKASEAGQRIHYLLNSGDKVTLEGFGMKADIQFEQDIEGKFLPKVVLRAPSGIRYDIDLSSDDTYAGTSMRRLLQKVIENGPKYEKAVEQFKHKVEGGDPGERVWPKQAELDAALAKKAEIDAEYKKLQAETEPKAGEAPDGEAPATEPTEFSIRHEAAPKKTGIGYKVFVLKNGKLYPPMVANPEGADTPVGVWLNADAAPVAGTSKTGRLQVKAGGKGTQGGSGQLAYRPGWHLGEIPYALQFNRKNPETGEKDQFPSNFVWAEVEYADDVDYQKEAMSYGMNASGKFQHSLAGLPRLPENGSYRYRTNPNPETDPWIITGAMKVNRVLKPSEVDQMVKDAGREPQKRQAGAVTDADIQTLNDAITSRRTEEERVRKVATDAVMQTLNDSGVRFDVVSQDEAARVLSLQQKTGNEYGKQLLRTSDGVVYGYSDGLGIKLTAAGINPDTPAHEYGHLWVKAVKRTRPDLWENIKGLMKEDEVSQRLYEKLLGDDAYSQIHGDEDRLYEEVLTSMAGKKNRQRFEQAAKEVLEEAQTTPDGQTAGRTSAVMRVLSRIRNAFHKLWSWIGKDLFKIKKFRSVDEVTDRMMYDFVNGTDIKTAADATDTVTEFQVGKGKPRQKKGESMAQYFQRLREWERRRVIEETDPEPMRPEIDGDPFSDEYRAACDEWRKAHEDWEIRHQLHEAENVDMRLYDEAINPDGETSGTKAEPTEEEALLESEVDARVMRDIGESVGFDTTPEGARRTAKFAIINRRKNLESASAEDAIWIHDLGKRINEIAKHQGVKPKELRDNLADIIEGTYFEDILRDDDGKVVAIVDISDQLPIKKDAELTALLNDIKEWYDNFYHLLEDAGLRGEAGYIADGYVNHIWDKAKSDPKAWDNYVRTKSANMRHREIETYREGREIGLVPKFTDIIDILSYYSRQNNEAIANRRLLDDLSCINIEEVNSDGEVTSSVPIITSSAPDIFTKDTYSKPYDVPGIGNVWVHKSAQRRFASVFGTERTQDIPEWLTGLGRKYDMAGSTMKKIQLSFSGFHMGALTEVALAQMRPDRAMKALMKYIVYDSLKQKTLPAYAHPEDFKFAAKHLVNLGATQDYAAADVNAITEKLHKAVVDFKNEHKNLATESASFVTALLDYMNKGMDKVLWNYIHDGFKIACFKMFAEQIDKRVAKKGLSGEERERLLDEAGQYVNDTFGGQYWELLNVTPAQLKWMRRALLSPDWLVSTQRHFFANFGFGSLYAEEGFLNYLKFNADNIKRVFGADIPRNEYRRFRSKNAKLCYLLGVCGFFYVMMNAINALYRMKDEEEERQKAEEIRKTNPNYKSPYELAYPDGMKWYDYTMYGNSIGQQTHLFLGRYQDGAEWYARWGKQFREFPELFMGRHGVEFPAPMIERMMGKSNPVIGYIRDGLGTLDIHGFNTPYQVKEEVAKYGKTVAFLSMTAKHFLPFSVPTQADKEFKTWDLVMPSQKGFSSWKAQDFFKTYILAGDMNGIEQTYNACVMNNIDAEKTLQAAIASVRASQRKELAEGVVDLTTAFERFNAAETLSEKKQMRNKIVKYLAEQNYKVFSREEALQKAQGIISGEDFNTAEKDDDQYVMTCTADDVRDDYKLTALMQQSKKVNDRLSEMRSDGVEPAQIQEYAERQRSWLQMRKIITNGRKQMNQLKKKLGQGDDETILEQIRDVRRKMFERIDRLNLPEEPRE